MSDLAMTSWKMKCLPPVMLACLLLQTGCSSGRLTYFDTKQGYIVLKAGQTYTAERDMTLATESTVQKKDEQILDLLKINQQLLRERQFQGSK